MRNRGSYTTIFWRKSTAWRGVPFTFVHKLLLKYIYWYDENAGLIQGPIYYLFYFNTFRIRGFHHISIYISINVCEKGDEAIVVVRQS